MKLYQKIASYALIGAASLGLFGCDNSNNNQNQQPQRPSYFASVPSQIRTGLAIKSGDFDGDGDLDLIVGSISGDGKLYQMINNGEGQFSEPQYFAQVPSQIRTGLAIESGDFDGDGDLDLIVGSISGDGKLYQMINNGEGQFSEPQYFAQVPSQIRTGLAIESGDFDGDGDLDLIVGSISGDGKFYHFKNDGRGNFSQ